MPRLVEEKRPEQLKMDFALWTRAAVMLLIVRECGVKMGVRGVGKYLKRWGFTPQKPIRRAYEQNPAAIQKWLDESYPAIAKRAKTQGAEIHWGNETALVNTDVRGRGYAPKGKTPVARVAGGTRQELSMISTVTNQGKACWEIIDGNLKGPVPLGPIPKVNAPGYAASRCDLRRERKASMTLGDADFGFG